MIIFLYAIICAAFLTDCSAARFGLFDSPTSSSSSSSGSSNIDELEYLVDNTRFSCMTYSNTGFSIDVNGSISSLVDRLDSGRGLSLFFHELANIVDYSNDLLFSFASEWFRTSRNNICIVTYGYTTNSSNSPEPVAILDKMVTTQRYEHIAKLAGDFVLGVREKCVNSNRRFCLRHLSQVDVSGFGVGAHIAGRTCQYLQQTLRQRPRILLALDPIKTPLLGTTIKDTIKRGDADYVQVIHTSQEVGIWDQLGDVDIYVRSDSQSHSDPLNDEHGIAFFIHLATSTKRLYLTASSNENGIGTVSIMPPMTKAIECLIGVYGFPKWNDIGKRFGFSLDNRSSLFWREMTHFAWTDIHLNSQLGAGVRPFGRTKLFSGTQPEVRVNESSDSDDDECTICCKNKINARLSCNHEMCHTCWIRWNYTPESQNKCPMCKQTVTSVDKFS